MTSFENSVYRSNILGESYILCQYQPINDWPRSDKNVLIHRNCWSASLIEKLSFYFHYLRGFLPHFYSSAIGNTNRIRNSLIHHKSTRFFVNISMTKLRAIKVMAWEYLLEINLIPKAEEQMKWWRSGLPFLLNPGL